MNTDLVLRLGAKFIAPFILIFALYVQFHGEHGPGGGFPAGVIASAMVVLVAITFGLRTAKLIAPQGVIERMVPLGVLIYAAVGMLSFLDGGNFLDYAVLADDERHAHELGILLVELGVFVTVAGTMTALFYAFVERGR